ncbi:MAG: lmo0937 family membrane protein [Deltaproteobacteria bacterium]|nr:lmo0937 family membrane protein [Deltaproteobacteria bacterium]
MGTLCWLFAVVFFVAWLLGIGGVYDGGGMVHVLLILAVLAAVFNLITGRKPVS